MKLTAEKIKVYFDERRPDFSAMGAKSLLELIYQLYSELHLMDDRRAHAALLAMQPFFDSLSLEDSDRFFGLIGQWCSECERLAFMEGVHVGVLLMEELSEK